MKEFELSSSWVFSSFAFYPSIALARGREALALRAVRLFHSLSQMSSMHTHDTDNPDKGDAKLATKVWNPLFVFPRPTGLFLTTEPTILTELTVPLLHRI